MYDDFLFFFYLVGICASRCKTQVLTESYMMFLCLNSVFTTYSTVVETSGGHNIHIRLTRCLQWEILNLLYSLIQCYYFGTNNNYFTMIT